MEKNFPPPESAGNSTSRPKQSMPRPKNQEASAEQEETPEYIRKLAVKVRTAMNDFKSLTWPLAMNKAFRKVRNLNKYGALPEDEEVLLNFIASELNKHQPPKAETKKKIKKIVPDARDQRFTPDQIETMMAQSEQLQAEDEKRAGQTREDSDL